MRMEEYWLLFVDTFYTNLAINPSSELVVHVMEKFPSYDKLVMFFVFFCGKFFANLVNYAFGILMKGIIFSISKTNHEESSSVKIHEEHYVSNYKIIKRICDKYYVFIIIPAFIPFYSKIAMTCFGITRSKLLFPAMGFSIIQVFVHILKAYL